MYFWDKHKTITSYYELLSGEVCDRYELTQMEYDILMFLHNNPQHNTAADIVKIRKSTKSHVSTSLKNLENKGLVERIQSKDNKKHIEIVLLDKAEVIVKAGINAQKQFAKDVLRAIDGEKYANVNPFDALNELEKVSGVAIPAPIKGIGTREVLHKDVIERDAIKEYVKSKLQ